MNLESYIGNQNIKKQVILAIASAIKRKEPISHLLFAGQPGCGKTSLAKTISEFTKIPLLHLAPDAIESNEDIVLLSKKISANKSTQNFIFIDEIHEISLKGQEALGIAMEERKVAINTGYVSKLLPLPPFTLIGATTVPGVLSKPFLDRFGMVLSFDFYNIRDCETITHNYLTRKLKKMMIDPKAVSSIAARGRGTPRVLEKLCDRVIDFIIVNDIKVLSESVVEEVMKIADIDKIGLTKQDISVLKTLYTAARPIGLENISASTGEDIKTISSKIEPFLIRSGFLIRTPQGRMLTSNGVDYLVDNKHVTD